MAIISSDKTGNWASDSTWVGGVPPGNDDIGQIEAEHTVTVADDAQALGIIVNGGTLELNADFTITDATGNGILINDVATSSWTSNGTASSPRMIKGASSSMSYPFPIRIKRITGHDARTLDFDYIEIRGNKYTFGTYDIYIDFNDYTSSTGGRIYDITPLVRDPELKHTFIPGRSSSIVRWLGNHAGTVTIKARTFYANYEHEIIKELAGYERISFFSRYTHLPKCKIERAVARTTAGKIDWTITLVEDV